MASNLCNVVFTINGLVLLGASLYYSTGGIQLCLPCLTNTQEKVSEP